MATETLAWASQAIGTDEQLAVLGTGSAYTATTGAGSGSVEVTATLLPGVDINADIDYNWSAYDVGYVNAGEVSDTTVFTGTVGGVDTTANSAFMLTNDIDDYYTSPAGTSHTVTARFDFGTNDSLTYDDGVENLNFWIGGIDSGASVDQLQILAYAPDGTQITGADIQLLSAGSNVSSGYTASGIATVLSNGGTAGADNQDGSINIVIGVPVGRIEIVYYNGSTGAQAIAVSDFTFDSIPLAPSCFAAGTLIKTTRGPVAVEALTTDDHVLTAERGPMQVRWIGHRTFAAKGDLAPICITKGTLGNTRDLLVSPAHRMAISGRSVAMLFAEDEVLVPAHALLNDDRIYRKTGGEVT